MSETQQEMEDFLQGVFTGQPRSPSEAVAAAEEPPEAPPEPPEQQAPPEDAPAEVLDAPPDQQQPAPVTPPAPDAPAATEPEEPAEEELDEDPSIVWAKKKYGDDSAKWAKAAQDQERYITQLSNEKREAEELAAQWYEYAQQAERQQPQLGGAMPLSAQEEQWIENSLSNPVEFARQAAFNGNVQLYNGVIQRVAEENAMLAAQIGTQVQTELAQYAAYQQQQAQVQQPSLADALGGSFQRLGIDLQSEGPRMAEKIAELGEYNPYVQAIMQGDDGQRDLAVQAVYDLTRATHTNTRRASREQNINRENELRRDAMVVQTGGLQAPPPPAQQPAFLTAMRDEWRARGQYADEEDIRPGS